MSYRIYYVLYHEENSLHLYSEESTSWSNFFFKEVNFVVRKSHSMSYTLFTDATKFSKNMCINLCRQSFFHSLKLSKLLYSDVIYAPKGSVVCPHGFCSRVGALQFCRCKFGSTFKTIACHFIPEND